MAANQDQVEFLILGLGWQGDYIQSECLKQGISFAATTTNGRNNTLPFKFDPAVSDIVQYQSLPVASTIIITFPLPTIDSAKIFMNLYKLAHVTNKLPTNFIIFGSTRAWVPASDNPWCNRHGPVKPDSRYQSEEAFLRLGGCVLNLAGLWGGPRHPSNWIDKVAPTKEALSTKGSLHLIHGADVARLVLAVSKNFTSGQRWIVTDLRIYDWYELVLALDNEKSKWVLDLYRESKSKALPRKPIELKRCLDSTDTWFKFGLLPTQSLYNSK